MLFRNLLDFPMLPLHGHFNKALVALRIGELRQALCRRLLAMRYNVASSKAVQAGLDRVYAVFPARNEPLRPFVLPFGYESFDK